MPTVTFIEFSGVEHGVEAPVGRSLMEAAVAHQVPGIVADCGGNCACATCQIYVPADWRDRLPPPSKSEREMIECALNGRDNSRLSCQIEVTPALEGLIVHMPESQT